MAKMHPAKLPDDVLDHPMYQGEVKTYDALAKLPDDYFVYYQCYANPDQNSRNPFERPIDFVILHRQFGVLAVEVKGGKILWQDNQFTQYQYDKGWQPTNPHSQVDIAARKLVTNCKKDAVKYWIDIATCVVFPDTRLSDITNLPNALPAATLYAEHMNMLDVQLKSLFPRHGKKEAFSERNFLDIQKRLSMHISNVKRKKKTIKEKIGYKPSASVSKKQENRNVPESRKIYTNPVARYDEHYRELPDPIRTPAYEKKQAVVKTGINHDPQFRYNEPPRNRPQQKISKQKLKPWHIFPVALGSGILAKGFMVLFGFLSAQFHL